MARNWWQPAALALAIVGAGCTVPNPRLQCKDDACTPDLAGTDSSAPGKDAAPTADLSLPPDLAGGPCTGGSCPPGRFCESGMCFLCDKDDRCGTDCRRCTGVAPYCAANGSECVVCRSDADCTVGGTFCDRGQCQPCNVAAHCGSTCAVCADSAQGICGDGRCACTAASQCGIDGDTCDNGSCRRNCLPLAPNCATAPAGKRCVNFGIGDDRCGCSGNGDCQAGATCTNKRCVCGGTVCKAGQSCVAGVCK